MKTKHTSIFNLITVFSQSQGRPEQKVSETDCEKNYHHDYYCDTEKPFIAVQ